MNRREVIRKFLTGGSVLVLVPSVIESCSSNNAVDNGITTTSSTIIIDLTQPNFAALNTAGGSAIIENILVININNSFIALSAVCTHQGCTVGYNSVANDIECPCHGSVYSIAGNVVVGPAISPLHSFAISQSGTDLTITI